MHRKPRILFCDDDPVYLAAIKRFLSRDDKFDCKTVESGEALLTELMVSKWDLILLDFQLQGNQTGFDFISRIREIDPDIFIVMLSGERGFDVVRSAIQAGARDYIPKDVSPEALVFSIEKVLESRQLSVSVANQKKEISRAQNRHDLIGSSEQVRQLRQLIEKARRTPFNVVITGETGVGKELVARQLRMESADGTVCPFVSVDSATIQSTTAESQLFGHEKGAFTGADKQSTGLFEEADGGIVYFDEIENMPLEIQAKLLRAIQEKEIVRFGGTRVIPLQFRVVCATNKDLPTLIQEGKFKADLYQRLNVIPIRVPSLRERRTDVPELLEFFADKHSFDGKRLEFSEEAINAFTLYSWPGNVRELSNVVAYLTAMKDDTYIELEDIPLEIRSPGRDNLVVDIKSKKPTEISDANYYRRMARYEKQILLAEYQLAEGNISKMARRMGLDRSTLYSKLNMHGVHQKKSISSLEVTDAL